MIFVHQQPETVFGFFALLSILKVLCNVKAMKTLSLTTLNPERLELCLKNIDDMSVQSVAARESILYAQSQRATIGVSMESISVSSSELIRLIEMHKKVQHILVNDPTGLKILLKKGCQEEDVLFAYCHAIHFSQTQSEQDSLKKTTEMFPTFKKNLE